MRAPKFAARFSSQEAALADFKLSQIFNWQIDAADGGVFGDIAKNVGHLQCIAEQLRVGRACWILAAENFDADEADGTGHSPAVATQVLIGLKASRLDIGFNSPHNLDQESAIDAMADQHCHEGLLAGFPLG